MKCPPTWKLAPDFGITGNGLAKLCRREDIPAPERGYWAKLQHGKKVVKPRLKGEHDAAIVVTASDTNRAKLEANMPTELAKALAAERARVERIAVPKVPKPHSLVEAWDRRRSFYGTEERLTPIEVRRRRIASVLFRELEKRGFSVEAEAPEKFKFRLLGVSINVVFRERSEMVTIPADPKRAHSYPSNEWRGLGLLKLRFENYLDVPVRREFKETPEKPLEPRLREIIIALYIAIEAERERTQRFEDEAHRRREAEKRRREAEERRRVEHERVEALKSDAKAWEEARRIREYVAAAIGVAGDAEWATWALAVADARDPLRRE